MQVTSEFSQYHSWRNVFNKASLALTMYCTNACMGESGEDIFASVTLVHLGGILLGDGTASETTAEVSEGGYRCLFCYDNSSMLMSGR